MKNFSFSYTLLTTAKGKLIVKLCDRSWCLGRLVSLATLLTSYCFNSFKSKTAVALKFMIVQMLSRIYMYERVLTGRQGQKEYEHTIRISRLYKVTKRKFDN